MKKRDQVFALIPVPFLCPRKGKSVPANQSAATRLVSRESLRETVFL
jgi:hypothetical protein